MRFLPLALIGALFGPASCPAQSPVAADAATLARAFSLFGRELDLRLTEDDLAWSPASVGSGLLMALTGARGETRTEMCRVLRLLDEDGVEWSTERLLSAVAGLAPRLRVTADGGVLRDANALWAQEGLFVSSTYRHRLDEAFGAGLRELDFAASEAARSTINAWVAERTEKRIEELIRRGDLDGGTALVLTNALYFQSSWRDQFAEAFTHDRAFTLRDGTDVEVPTMRRIGSYRVGGDEQVRVVELPFALEPWVMTIAIPAEGCDLAVVEARLAAVQDRLEERKVDLRLPRFTVRAHADLEKHLAALGMPSAFSRGADFGGIHDGRYGLWIAKVIHEGFVRVDEGGAEAAASTAVVMKRGGPMPDEVFAVDRPFRFAIRDPQTGLELFLGRVVDPR